MTNELFGNLHIEVEGFEESARVGGRLGREIRAVTLEI